MSEAVKTIRLKHPVQLGEKDQQVEELAFRRGRVGDLKGVGDDAGFDDLMIIASRLAGVPLRVIERLDEEDAGEVLAYAMSFMRRCLSTGAPSSAS